MAVSIYPTSLYPSEQFVESCGAVLFDLSREPRQVCLIQYIKTGEWLLPKGRRNLGESRKEAALREVQEETGHKCHVHPVDMLTRAPGLNDTGDVPDEPRMCSGLDEPFMLTVRELDGTSGVKLIWWFVAAVDDRDILAGSGSEGFRAEFFDFGDALKVLKFQKDREVLARAVVLVECS